MERLLIHFNDSIEEDIYGMNVFFPNTIQQIINYLYPKDVCLALLQDSTYIEIETKTYLNFYNSIQIDFHCKMLESGGINKYILYKQNSFYIKYNENNKLEFGLYDGTNFQTLESLDTIIAGSMNKITFTYNGFYAKCYIDGLKNSEKELFLNINSSTNNLFIGTNSIEYLKLELAELRIKDDVSSDSHIFSESLQEDYLTLAPSNTSSFFYQGMRLNLTQEDPLANTIEGLKEFLILRRVQNLKSQLLEYRDIVFDVFTNANGLKYTLDLENSDAIYNAEFMNYISSTNKILRTNNLIPENQSWSAFAFVAVELVEDYVATQNNRIYYSLDDGSTWIECEYNKYIYLYNSNITNFKLKIILQTATTNIKGYAVRFFR